MEVENALKTYLAGEAPRAHTPSTLKRKPSLAQRRVEAIIHRLHEEGFENQFTIEDWARACALEIGADPRTIKKYLKLAKELGKVKHVNRSIWEIK